MPSEKVLLAKQEKVAKLTDLIKNSAAGVLVDYKGLTVEEDTKLRKELREAGVTYFVEKNTILRFALHNAGFESFDGVLEGTTAFAVSNDDQTAPARVLGKFGEQCFDVRLPVLSDPRVEVAVNAPRGAEGEVDVDARHTGLTSKSFQPNRAWSRWCRHPPCTCPSRIPGKKRSRGRSRLPRPGNPLRAKPNRPSILRRR